MTLSRSGKTAEALLPCSPTVGPTKKITLLLCVRPSGGYVAKIRSVITPSLFFVVDVCELPMYADECCRRVLCVDRESFSSCVTIV